MKLTGQVQEALVALLCYDGEYGKVVSSLVPVRDFDPVYRAVADKATSYWENFKAAPGSHTLDIFNDIIADDPEREDIYERLHRSIRVTVEETNPKYIIEKARDFVRYQSLKRGLSEAIAELEKDSKEGVEGAEQALAACLGQQADIFDPGLDFIKDVDRSTAFFNIIDDALPSGIPCIDERGIGPGPDRLLLFVAPSGRGKSWYLTNLATRAFQHGKKVLYISLELSEEEVAQRMAQSFWAMSKRDVREVSYQKFVKTDDPSEWGMDAVLKKFTPKINFEQEDAELEVRKKMRLFADRERVVLKAFPPGTLTQKELGAYLDLLEQHDGFIPDIILLDYADEMNLQTGSKSRWEGLLEVFQYLKRVAMERHVAVATASQTKVSGATASRVDVEHTGGSWDKVAKADVVLTYSQTDEERKDRLARIFVAKARSDADRFEVLISQSYDTGQFCLSSIPVGDEYRRNLENGNNDAGDID